MKNYIRKNNGITLIALIVTIVVLLILAGVTINLIFSENGIILKAREASEKTNESIIKEQEVLNKADEYINNINANIVPDKPDNPTENWDLSKVNPIESKDETPIIVPVPKGYTASNVDGENTVKDGFVIYEGTDEVNDTNKDTARLTKNQFVWVPVSDINEMYGTDSTGKKWGKTYTFSEEGITALNWEENNGIMQLKNSTGDGSYREPDILTSFDTDAELSKYNIGASTQIEFNNQLEDEFYSMLESVEKYGGFYIGRYETGNLNQKEAVVVKNNNDIAMQNWYTQYNLAKTIAADTNVTTTMIWGSQWDATMRWMYESGDLNKKIYTYNSDGKGNYNSDAIIPTGTIEEYSVNNIYDMAGNVVDWTIEANTDDYRINRGGNINHGGMEDPASERYIDDSPTTNNTVYGSRVSLYISK